MPQLAACVAIILLRCAAGTTVELTFPTEAQAADGWHTLTLAQNDFAGGAYGITTRTYTEGYTFRMKPGETLQVTVVNDLLSANSVGCDVTGTEFCKAATTNFHTHGLHVSSKGSDELTYASDDVFASISPGSSKQYEFSIPDYHMGGTHWYHPHLHHATSLQAGGGAAGVLIVDDPAGYLPDVYSSMVEKVLFITGHNLVTLQELAIDAQSTVLEEAATDANAAGLDTNVFLVNGQLGRTMTIASHVWHRLRMIYAAVEQTLTVTVDGDATCDLQLLAKDGIYLNEIPRAINIIYLYPGSRADVAMSCTCTTYPCTAEVRSQAARRLQPGGGQGQGGQGPGNIGMDVADVVLLTVSVTETVGGTVETLDTTTLDRPCYLADLRQATIPSGQSGALAFNLGTMSVNWDGTGDSMNYANIEAAGGMASWTALTSFTTGTVYEIAVNGVGNHPLHSHVIPFQIQDMDGSDSLDDGYFQAGDWHDTLYLEALGGGTLVARMNTDRFTGKMVVHCHILSHEDSGMMGYISLTGTEGAVFEEAKTLDPTCYDIAFAVASAPTSSPTPVESTITPSTTAPSTITSTASATSTSAPASSSTTSVSTSTFSSLVTPTAASSATFTASLSTSTSGSVVATTTDSSATSISAVSTATSTFMTTSAFTVASSVTSTTSNYCGCSDELEPVCGFDGATYSSACFAECYIGGYQYDGECVGASLDCGACADSDRDCKPDASATWDEVICDDGYFPVLGYYCHPGCDSCFGCFVDGTAPTTPPTSTAPVRGPASLIFLVGTMLLQ